MKNYEQIEQDIVDILNADQYLSGIASIEPLPDNEAEYSKNFTKPKIYIVYTGSVFDSPETNFAVIQSELMSFEALIRSSTRRGDGGILNLLSKIGSLLQGRRMYLGCDPIALDKNGYIEGLQLQNNFNYVLSFNIMSKSSSILPDPEAEDPANNVYLLKTPEFIQE